MRYILDAYGYEIVECQPQVRCILTGMYSPDHPLKKFKKEDFLPWNDSNFKYVTRVIPFKFPRIIFLKRPAFDESDYNFFDFYYLAEPFEEAASVYTPYWGKQDLPIDSECLNHENQIELSWEPIKNPIDLFWRTVFNARMMDQFSAEKVNIIQPPSGPGWDKDKVCAEHLEIDVDMFRNLLAEYKKCEKS